MVVRGPRRQGHPLVADTFRTEGLYSVGAFAVLLVLVALYAMFWAEAGVKAH